MSPGVLLRVDKELVEVLGAPDDAAVRHGRAVSEALAASLTTIALRYMRKGSPDVSAPQS